MTPEKLRFHARLLMRRLRIPGCTSDDLAGVLEQGIDESFEKGMAICREGSRADELFFLINGKVSVLQADADGDLREVAVMVPPALFGHMGLVDGSKRSATCKAKVDCTVVIIDRAHYNRLIGSPSSVGATLRRMMLSSFTRQLTGANQRVRDLLIQVDPAEKLSDDVSHHDMAGVARVLNGWELPELSDADVQALDELERLNR